MRLSGSGRSARGESSQVPQAIRNHHLNLKRPRKAKLRWFPTVAWLQGKALSIRRSGKRSKDSANGQISQIRETIMTGCIVGWAHTPFGKLDGEDRREPDRARRDRRAGRCRRSQPADVDEIVLGHFNAGFSPQDFTAVAGAAGLAGPALQARHRGSRTPAPPVRRPCIRACSRSPPERRAIVLVVGVEQMTTTPAAEIGTQPAQGLLCARGSRHRRRLRRHLRQDRRRCISRNRATSPTRWR